MAVEIPSYLLSPGCAIDICRTSDCADAVKQNPATGRWFITMSHPGFNTPANNGRGYATAAAARSATRRCARR